MSIWGSIFDPSVHHLGIDTAVSNSIAAGVTYCVIAGNANADAINYTPADVVTALTVGAIHNDGLRASFSNFGSVVDVFAPGTGVLSAFAGSDSQTLLMNGTSMASPHVAGAVAMYLQGRIGTFHCGQHPIQSPASSIGGPISTCPDRVVRFINSNANLNKLGNLQGSANRFLWTVAVPTTTNPVDNQRFFTWQQYSDFLPYDPDEGGLAFWAGQMSTHCGTGVNDNNPCVRDIRAQVSKEFFRVAFPSAFANNSEFIHRCYEAYLRRTVSANDGGFQFWLGQLNSFGTPASEAGKNALIDAFITSTEYRQRFGQP